MTDIEALVIEWRDARDAIAKVDWGNPANWKPELWMRLGLAEGALMARARQIVMYPGDREAVDAYVAEGPRQHGWPVGTRICDCVTGEVEPQPCHCERAKP